MKRKCLTYLLYFHQLYTISLCVGTCARVICTVQNSKMHARTKLNLREQGFITKFMLSWMRSCVDGFSLVLLFSFILFYWQWWYIEFQFYNPHCQEHWIIDSILWWFYFINYSETAHLSFWFQVLYDIGVVSTKEPFKCLINQGIILGEVSRCTCLYWADVIVHYKFLII